MFRAEVFRDSLSQPLHVPLVDWRPTLPRASLTVLYHAARPIRRGILKIDDPCAGDVGRSWASFTGGEAFSWPERRQTQPGYRSEKAAGLELCLKLADTQTS